MKQIVLCIALAVGAFGQTAASTAETTGGSLNGRFWRSMTVDQDQKIVFVLGYSTAIQYAVTGMSSLLKVNNQTLLDSLFPSRLTGAELVSALDRFYDTPENGPITINAAVKLIAQRVSGADEATIQKAIADARSAYAGR